MDEEISRLIIKIIFAIFFLSVFSNFRKKEHSSYSLRKDCYENLEAAKKGSLLNIFVVIMLFGSIFTFFGIIIYTISNSILITLTIITIALCLSLRIIYHKKEIYIRENLLAQKQNQLALQKYEEIQVKWGKKQLDNQDKALQAYPSKHLLNNEDEWIKMIEKQAAYTSDKNEIYANELQKEYNLTKEEWKELESQYFIESSKILREHTENKSK